MTLSRTLLCTVYAVIAGFSLVVTWMNITGLIEQEGMMEGTVKFWEMLLLNEASRFIAVDILFFTLTAMIVMVLEARRLHIPLVWGYILFGIFVGISAAAPLFLIHRETILARIHRHEPAGHMTIMDLLGIGLITAGFTAYALLTLIR